MPLDTRQSPIINCHTHIFTGDHIPPWLAKTYLPWPVYYLVSTRMIIWLFRMYYSREWSPYRLQFLPWYKRWLGFKNRLWRIIHVTRLSTILYWIITGWVGLMTIYLLEDWFSTWWEPSGYVPDALNQARIWLDDHQFVWFPQKNMFRILWIVVVLGFFKSVRNLVFSVSGFIWNFLRALPGKETKAMVERYILLGRFAFYQDQSKIFDKMSKQYPPGSQFVVLPMDMAYMQAGQTKEDYHDQLAKLLKLKQSAIFGNQVLPFVFIDPRRITDEPDFLQYQINLHRVKLNDCKVKTYFEHWQFSGIKIYPALGYYPFDERLLPIWKYAADHQIPIMTHCIRGTIYYRGKKDKAWDYHPVFEQSMGEGNYEKLALFEQKNIDFSVNFTHPLNYLCLLEERLLRKVVAQAQDDRIRQLFGYRDLDTPLETNLKNLKICFGHFGGDDEWNRFLESDRYSYAQQLVNYPDRGVLFLDNHDNEEERPGKIEQLWQHCDWYTLICSMMLQFPNVYADISYIVHNPLIQPLLIETIQEHHPKWRNRVLFGTDFYVVRNHKSEKNILIELQAALGPHLFDLIARENPKSYLMTSK